MGQITIGNITGFWELLDWANTASNGLLAILMLSLVFFVIFYRNNKAGDTNYQASGSALYVTLIVAALFWWGALIPFDWVLLFTVAIATHTGLRGVLS